MKVNTFFFLFWDFTTATVAGTCSIHQAEMELSAIHDQLQLQNCYLIVMKLLTWGQA